MHDVPLLTTVAAGFAAAWILGLITQRIGLSPIVGYLLAGVVIGPHTPGFVGDEGLAPQLAEVGVILMMFGVGLHFKLKDLMKVKGVAIPGAIGQSLVATILAMVIFHFFGWSWKSGAVLGMAMAVASTVVLLRVLMDRDMLNTVHGHVAVGWLIVEDIFTVLALVFVPMLAADMVVSQATDPAALQAGAEAAAQSLQHAAEAGHEAQGGHAAPAHSGLATIGIAIAKLIALVAIVLFAGSKIVPWMLAQVAKLRSRELFTLTVLVLSITIAVGSAVIFGASVALGAFLAGMVVAQSPASHQAAADALPMRDAFSVLFFVAIGMLFDPRFIVEEPLMVLSAIGIVLLAKPMAALVIVAIIGYPARTALTVALGLAQIGEFSFILGQVAFEHGLLSEDGRNILVAAAMVSITLNPLLFGSIDSIERWLSRRPFLWKLLNARADQRRIAINADAKPKIEAAQGELAIIVGYGPVGRVVDALLRDAGIQTVIVEMNMQTVEALTKSGRAAIYGDATRPEILEDAGLRRAAYLVMTLPQAANRDDLIHAARELNPDVELIVRARYLAERDALVSAGVNRMVFEEGETGIAMARQVMERRGLDNAAIDKMLDAIRRIWKMKT